MPLSKVITASRFSGAAGSARSTSFGLSTFFGSEISAGWILRLIGVSRLLRSRFEGADFSFEGMGFSTLAGNSTTGSLASITSGSTGRDSFPLLEAERFCYLDDGVFFDGGLSLLSLLSLLSFGDFTDLLYFASFCPLACLADLASLASLSSAIYLVGFKDLDF